MNEEIFISGRNIPHIDPHLNVWHWPIPVYLFLGGLAAGILFFSSLYTILGKEKEMPATVKWSTFIVPVALVLGLGALFIDLKHQLYFWRLYTTIRLESPMSWGAWVLLAITPLSFIWAAVHIKALIPAWDWKFGFINNFEKWVIKHRKGMAWILIILSVILGVYTGILLSAFNARPLWNTSLLGPLFLVSGMSTGIAAILLTAKDQAEKRRLIKIDILLIVIELFFIIHLFMGFLAGPAVQVEAAYLFLGGHFTWPFWGIVVTFGLLIPVILEMLELAGKKIPAYLPALLILLGGLAFRYIMVEAGELTRYLY